MKKYIPYIILINFWLLCPYVKIFATSLDELNTDIQMKILSQLSSDDLMNVCHSCKRLRHTTKILIKEKIFKPKFACTSLQDLMIINDENCIFSSIKIHNSLEKLLLEKKFSLSKNIIYCDLQNDKLSFKSFLHLCDIIAKSKSIKTLIFRKSNLKDKYSKSLFKSLKKNCSILYLDLYLNSITYTSLKNINIDLMNIRFLNLSNNLLNDKSAKYISYFLRENQNLHYLDIGMSYFTAEGAKIIGEGLRLNNHLVDFTMTSNINHCGIGFKGFEYLSKALSSNKCLERLNISDQNCQDKGIYSIIDMLQLNNKINTLQLNGNSISVNATEALFDSLINNKNLTCLSISNTPLSNPEARLQIQQICQNFMVLHPTLKIIDVQY